MNETLLHGEISDQILKSFFTVNKAFPIGFPIELYKKAIPIEFEINGLTFTNNHSIIFSYKNTEIGTLCADFLINSKVLVLIENVNHIDKNIEQKANLLLRYSEYEVCIILNIGGDRDFKRIIFTNDL